MKEIFDKKWPREILGARSTRKDGLPSEPKSLSFHGGVIFWCKFPIQLTVPNRIAYLDGSSYFRLPRTAPGRCLGKLVRTNVKYRRIMSSSIDRKTTKNAVKVVKGRPTKELPCNYFYRVCKCDLKRFYSDLERLI